MCSFNRGNIGGTNFKNMSLCRRFQFWTNLKNCWSLNQCVRVCIYIKKKNWGVFIAYDRVRLSYGDPVRFAYDRVRLSYGPSAIDSKTSNSNYYVLDQNQVEKLLRLFFLLLFFQSGLLCFLELLHAGQFLIEKCRAWVSSTPAAHTSGSTANSQHWFTTSFLQPLPQLRDYAIGLKTNYQLMEFFVDVQTFRLFFARTKLVMEPYYFVRQICDITGKISHYLC